TYSLPVGCRAGSSSANAFASSVESCPGPRAMSSTATQCAPGEKIGWPAYWPMLGAYTEPGSACTVLLRSASASCECRETMTVCGAYVSGVKAIATAAAWSIRALISANPNVPTTIVNAPNGMKTLSDEPQSSDPMNAVRQAMMNCTCQTVHFAAPRRVDAPLTRCSTGRLRCRSAAPLSRHSVLIRYTVAARNRGK